MQIQRNWKVAMSHIWNNSDIVQEENLTFMWEEKFCRQFATVMAEYW